MSPASGKNDLERERWPPLTESAVNPWRELLTGLRRARDAVPGLRVFARAVCWNALFAFQQQEEIEVTFGRQICETSASLLFCLGHLFDFAASDLPGDPAIPVLGKCGSD